MSPKMLFRFLLIAVLAGVGLLQILTLASGRASFPIEPASVPEVAPRTAASVTPGGPAYQAEPWVYTGGPIGGLGYDVRMDPRDPDVMYVTDAYAGVFKSTDGGANWAPINDGITPFGTSGDGFPVFSLTIDPNNPDRLWVGTQYSGDVYRSDDGGANWTSMNNGITETSLSTRGLTVEPGNSDVVYLAGEVSSWEWNGEPLPGLGLDMTMGVVYKTENAGQSWTRLWYGDNLARYIWIHPTNHDLLYVSTGIFDREAANSDAGTLDPGGVGILRSSDGGKTWQVLDEANGLNAEELYFGSLYMHPTNPSVLLAAAGNDPYTTPMGRLLGGIYRTANGGDSWTEVLGPHNFSIVEICEGDPNVAYAGSVAAFYRSMDGGLTWQEVAGVLWGPPDTMAGVPIDAQCDPRDAMRVFVNNYGGGNFLSEDGGATWTVSSAGYTGALMRQVAVAGGDPARVYASARSGLFSSRDGGKTWHGLAYGAARHLDGFTIAVDPDDSVHILATELDAGPNPLASRDGGRTWTVVDTGLWVPGDMSPGVGVTQIIFAPTDSQTVYAAVGADECLLNRGCGSSPGRGIIVSRDGGESWTQSNLTSGNVLGLAVSPLNSSRAYAAVHGGGLYRSNDSGATWQLVSQNPVPSSSSALRLGEAGQLDLKALAIVAGIPDKLYAGYRSGAVAVSGDGGVTWTASASGMPAEADVVALAIDPTDSDVVYAGTLDSGVYVSQNGGTTWTTLNSGLLNRAVRDLALSDDGSVLYMASEGGGVFRLGTPLVPTPTPTWTPGPTVTPTPTTTSAPADTSTPTLTTTPTLPSGTQTPTPAATITPTSRPCENLLSHGDFEAGLLPPWGTIGSTQVTAARAHGGERSALLGGANDAIDELFAGIGLLPDITSITLSYWWYVESTDPDPGADRLVVVIETPERVVQVETLTNDSPGDSWHSTTFDLSSYAGQDLGLTFHAETNEANPTSFYLDDVEILVCGAAPPEQRVYLPQIRKGG